MINGKINIKNDRIEDVKRELEAKMATALETIGMMAETDAKLLCPVDTGRLRNSIAHAVDRTSVIIGTNVEYAPYIEFGTSKMDAQPFLLPAVRGQLEAYKQVLESVLKS